MAGVLTKCWGKGYNFLWIWSLALYLLSAKVVEGIKLKKHVPRCKTIKIGHENFLKVLSGSLRDKFWSGRPSTSNHEDIGNTVQNMNVWTKPKRVSQIGSKGKWTFSGLLQCIFVRKKSQLLNLEAELCAGIIWWRL